MAVTDLNEVSEDTSTEEIQDYVEQVTKEVEEERAGEEKSDAQITSEQANTPQPAQQKTPAENNSGSETAEVEDQGEETGIASKSYDEWFDDSAKAEVAAYGIEESEIADFASREEFDRALRLLDKSAMETGRQALAESEGDQGQPRNEKGQFETNPEPNDDDQYPDVGKRDGQYEITLDEDVYDEEIVGEFTRMRDHYDSRLEALEGHLIEADAMAEEQYFDNLVDSLGHTDLFGKTDNETPKQLERRQDLIVAVKAQQIGLEQLGRPTEITESLINRVSHMVFAEDLGKKDLKKRTRKISRQSNGRQGGGVPRPQDPRDDPRAEADRLYRELDGS